MFGRTDDDRALTGGAGSACARASLLALVGLAALAASSCGDGDSSGGRDRSTDVGGRTDAATADLATADLATADLGRRDTTPARDTTTDAARAPDAGGLGPDSDAAPDAQGGDASAGPDLAPNADASPDAGRTPDAAAPTDVSPEPDAVAALPDAGPLPDTAGLPAASGELVVLTYNVAGLPEGISRSHPERNIPQISPLLNAYELVGVQEDFWYPVQLRADTDHPFRTETEPALADGLNRFARHPFVGFVREPWSVCFGRFDHGSDCLAAKGFSFARHHLARGVELDVYNLHLEAGGAEEDDAARAAQVEQLLEWMDVRSAGRPVLLMGDTNLHAHDVEDVPVLQRLLADAGLTDVCRALACGDERIDRILIRSSDELELEPLQWWLPHEFVDEDGEPLSDHAPVAARLGWRVP